MTMPNLYVYVMPLRVFPYLHGAGFPLAAQVYCTMATYHLLWRGCMHSGESLFPNICGLPLLLFIWLKWAGYLAVAGLNLLTQISERISPFGV